MKRVVIIQARMTSTRLPGKVLLDLAGRPLLGRQLERLRRCARVDELVIATTTNQSDDALAALAEAEGARCFRGDEHDVLSRYGGAARASGADVVVRVTSDCPLIEPALVDRVLDELGAAPCDYASNTRARTYPRGLDVEAFFADVLYRMERLATSQPAREHVTWLLHRERPELFVCRDVTDGEDHSDLRWTVDTAEDLAMVRRLWDEAGLAARWVPYRELVAFVRARPELAAMNLHVRQATL